MSNPILATGAAGGPQGSTGRNIANLLLDRGLRVRALVRRLDARSNGLRERGAEVVEGDLLNLTTIRSAFILYLPVADGLLKATAIFAGAAREAGTELVVNNSQFQGTAAAPSLRNLQHLPIASSIGHRLGQFIFKHRLSMKTSAH